MRLGEVEKKLRAVRIELNSMFEKIGENTFFGQETFLLKKAAVPLSQFSYHCIRAENYASYSQIQNLKGELQQVSKLFLEFDEKMRKILTLQPLKENSKAYKKYFERKLYLQQTILTCNNIVFQKEHSTKRIKNSAKFEYSGVINKKKVNLKTFSKVNLDSAVDVQKIPLRQFITKEDSQTHVINSILKNLHLAAIKVIKDYPHILKQSNVNIYLALTPCEENYGSILDLTTPTNIFLKIALTKELVESSLNQTSLNPKGIVMNTLIHELSHSFDETIFTLTPLFKNQTYGMYKVNKIISEVKKEGFAYLNEKLHVNKKELPYINIEDLSKVRKRDKELYKVIKKTALTKKVYEENFEFEEIIGLFAYVNILVSKGSCELITEKGKISLKQLTKRKHEKPRLVFKKLSALNQFLALTKNLSEEQFLKILNEALIKTGIKIKSLNLKNLEKLHLKTQNKMNKKIKYFFS